MLLPLLQAQVNKVVGVAAPEPLVAKPGGTVEQVLKVTVRDGYHVNSDKPIDEFIIPLKLTWTGPLEVKQVIFPKAEEINVNGQKLTVFTGSFPVRTQLSIPASAAKGKTTVTGKLRYQACSNEMCLRPTTVDIELPLTIE
jgi:DsbC/DsbD-like thiol-disulfide interchange protein